MAYGTFPGSSGADDHAVRGSIKSRYFCSQVAHRRQFNFIQFSSAAPIRHFAGYFRKRAAHVVTKGRPALNYTMSQAALEKSKLQTKSAHLYHYHIVFQQSWPRAIRGAASSPLCTNIILYSG